MRRRLDWFNVLNYMILTLFCLSILYPFYYLISISLSTAGEIYTAQNTVFYFPSTITWEAYQKFLSMDYVYTGYFNTVFRTVAGTSLSLIVMSCAAYALSKKTLPHLNLYTTFFIVTMFFGGGLIPTYLLIRQLNLLDNIWVFVFGGLVNAFYMLILRNFFMSIPEEMEESARMDGAGDALIFARIVVPLSLPALATISLWLAVGHWNAWFDSLIYIKSIDKHVISVHIRRLVIEQDQSMSQTLIGLSNRQRGDKPTPEGMRAAAIMVTIIPILCVYPFVQKYFVQGVMVGAVKG